MQTYQRLHGTTVDQFKIGLKNQRIVLTGQTIGNSSTVLKDRDNHDYSVAGTVFFTAYVIGQGTNTAAYEIKGCYLTGTTTVTGYVVNTFVDTNNFDEPAIVFSNQGLLAVTCTGKAAETINWTATIDFVLV